MIEKLTAADAAAVGEDFGLSDLASFDIAGRAKTNEFEKSYSVVRLLRDPSINSQIVTRIWKKTIITHVIRY